MVLHTFNPSTQEAEAGRSLLVKSDLVYKGNPGQSVPHTEIWTQKEKKKSLFFFIQSVSQVCVCVCVQAQVCMYTDMCVPEHFLEPWRACGD